MTTQQIWSVATKRLLDEVLAELLTSADQGNALHSAIIAAVEGATLIAAAAEEAGRPGRENEAVELAQQALGAMRASVVANTMSVQTLADQRRAHGRADPTGRSVRVRSARAEARTRGREPHQA